MPIRIATPKSFSVDRKGLEGILTFIVVLHKALTLQISLFIFLKYFSLWKLVEFSCTFLFVWELVFFATLNRWKVLSPLAAHLQFPSTIASLCFIIAFFFFFQMIIIPLVQQQLDSRTFRNIQVIFGQSCFLEHTVLSHSHASSSEIRTCPRRQEMRWSFSSQVPSPTHRLLSSNKGVPLYPHIHFELAVDFLLTLNTHTHVPIGIQLACKVVSNSLKRAGFEEVFGYTGTQVDHSFAFAQIDRMSTAKMWRNWTLLPTMPSKKLSNPPSRYCGE